MAVRLAAAALAAMVWCGCGEGSGATPDPKPEPEVTDRLEVFPAWTRAAVGVQRPVEVWLRRADGGVEDVTARAQVVTDGAVIVEAGALRIMEVGQGRVLARLDGATGEARVEGLDVAVEGLRVRPASVTLAPGERQRLQAFGRFGGGPEIELTGSALWSRQAEPGVLTVEAASVVAEGEGQGAAVATLGAQSAQAVVRVSSAPLEALSIERERLVLPVGASLPVEAQGRYEGEGARPMTAQAAWSSSDEVVVAVGDEGDAKGLVSARAVGVAEVVARVGERAARMEVEVVALEAVSVAITPGDGVMGAGEEGQFSASAIFEDGSSVYVTREAVWESSDPAVLAVGNGPRLGGQVTAMGPGQAVLRVRFGEASGELVVRVDPAP